MNSVEILANGIALPKQKVENKVLEDKFNLEENWIYNRTGINTRYYVKNEDLKILALNAVKNMLEKINVDVQEIGIIVFASTSTKHLMPGISYIIQKELDIKKCMCLDILCGCCGYINAFDIVRKYIALGEVKYGIIIGADVLSDYTDDNDINTKVLLGDGAGATLLGKSNEKKIYFQNITSEGQKGEILTCNQNSKIFMDGKKVYKFGTTKPVECLKELLENAGEKIENIKYIIPHQSNLKMMKSMSEKLNIDFSKMYINIDRIGNTFNASIPIALNEMIDKNLIQRNDKIVLLGYGGGLNLGAILLEY